MEHIPILRLGEFLLVTIQVDIHDRLALKLREELGQVIVQDQVRGVVIEISSLDTLDTFIARILSEIARTSKLLGAETVIVGMRPAVALTLVELGMTLAAVHTAIDVDRGVAWLRSRRNGDADGDADGDVDGDADGGPEER